MATSPLSLPPLTPEKALLRVLGSGPSFPFSFSATGNVRSVQLANGLQKVNQAIHSILSTRPGERMFLPEFGCFAAGTTVRLLSGRQVPIEDLVSVGNAWSFGVISDPGTAGQPPQQSLVATITKGAVLRGLRNTVVVSLSNGERVRCTPDHAFLLASNHRSYEEAQNLLPGTRLAWLDRTTHDLTSRIAAWRQVRGPVRLQTMPMSKGFLSVVSVVDAEPAECYDLLDSQTENYTLGAGPIVHNSNLPRLVFEPNDALLADKLRFWTADALARWEKRITVTKIELIDFALMGPADAQQLGISPTLLNASVDTSTIGIYIQYTINRTYVQGSYVYPFVLGGMPMQDTVTGANFRSLGSP